MLILKIQRSGYESKIHVHIDISLRGQSWFPPLARLRAEYCFQTFVYWVFLIVTFEHVSSSGVSKT